MLERQPAGQNRPPGGEEVGVDDLLRNGELGSQGAVRVAVAEQVVHVFPRVDEKNILDRGRPGLEEACIGDCYLRPEALERLAVFAGLEDVLAHVGVIIGMVHVCRRKRGRQGTLSGGEKKKPGLTAGRRAGPRQPGRGWAGLTGSGVTRS